MQISHVEKDFEIYGLKARTSNADEIGGRGKIANLWNEFLKFGFDGTGETRIAKTQIYAAYFDYEDGVNGEYSVLIGSLPTGKFCAGAGDRVQIKAGDYVVFDFPNEPQKVAKFWGEIWKYFESSRLKRAYETDFEKHLKDKIQIYISIK